MPIPTDYRDITYTLIEKTDAGDVKWHKEKYNSMTVSIDKAKFSLWVGSDPYTTMRFVAFSLADGNDKPLDTWSVKESDVDYDKMNDFFLSAHRHATNVPNRLKELHELISKTKTIGVPDEA